MLNVFVFLFIYLFTILHLIRIASNGLVMHVSLKSITITTAAVKNVHKIPKNDRSINQHFFEI